MWIDVDNSRDRKEAFEFTVGQGLVTRGLDEGVVGMRLYEKATIMVSARYAYGKRGAGTVVPPNVPIRYTVGGVAMEEVSVGKKPPRSMLTVFLPAVCGALLLTGLLWLLCMLMCTTHKFLCTSF